LQLDLLQLKDKQDSHTQGNGSSGQDKINTAINSTSGRDDLQQVKGLHTMNYSLANHGIDELHPFPDFFGLLFQVCCSGSGCPCGDHSSSSSVLELFLQEDSHSGTGSAMSASTGSISNDCNSSISGTGLHI